ncbi:hypothetical protein PoB_000395400 [Plakobranchus ocellatus]|uniref:Uncharacterized protein n=1 Tax=Plakobranchus ocellatus TaxID=259542 RepID=A0AAV3Y5E1_9GAST|nr:hypothetical protein PoB_000395400 [Plakobranchus ocellatus]
MANLPLLQPSLCPIHCWSVSSELSRTGAWSQARPWQIFLCYSPQSTLYTVCLCPVNCPDLVLDLCQDHGKSSSFTALTLPYTLLARPWQIFLCYSPHSALYTVCLCPVNRPDLVLDLRLDHGRTQPPQLLKDNSSWFGF